MLRRITLLSLIMLAFTVAIIDWLGYVTPVRFSFSASEEEHGYLLFADGLVRLYSYRADEAIEPRFTPRSSRVDFHRTADDAHCLRIRHAMPSQIPAHAVLSSTFSANPRLRQAAGTPVPTTKIKLSGIRTSGSLILVLMLLYPSVAVISDLWNRRRLKVGQCSSCGYNLKGNASGLCTECGASLECAKCGEPWGDVVPESCPGCGGSL
ncbi:MAG: hypothetical protein ACYTHJ_06315 [Planctomycetota bacterium]|jgi:hypothetical protein